MRHAAFLLVGACAPTGALAIGPTLDGDHVVRLEGQADGGTIGNGNNVTGLGDPSQTSFGVLAVGLRLALATGTHLSDSQGWLAGYIEYLQLAKGSGDWGFHGGLTFGFTFQSEPKLLVGLDVGLDRTAHAHSSDTGDGFATTFVTDGFDLVVRGRGGNWWQVGAHYVRRGSLLYE